MARSPRLHDTTASAGQGGVTVGLPGIFTNFQTSLIDVRYPAGQNAVVYIDVIGK